jgi:hypothetical protein
MIYRQIANTTCTFRRATSLLLSALALFSWTCTLAGGVAESQAASTSRLKEGLELYLSGLPLITEKTKVLSAKELEKERKKKDYDVAMPVLKHRARMEILAKHILEGDAAKDYAARQASTAMEISLGSLKNLGILRGPDSAPEQQLIDQISRTQGTISATEKLGLVGRMLYPIADVAEIRKEQATVSLLVESPDVLADLRKEYDLLEKEESSIISLYRYEDDPMFSANYQKLLVISFIGSSNGKFLNKMWIEFMKRLSFDVTILFLSLTLCYMSFIFCRSLGGALWGDDAFVKKIEFKDKKGNGTGRRGLFLAASYSLPTIVSTVITLRMLYNLYMRTTRYISKRLGSVQRLFEIAMIVDHYVQSNPVLEQSCGPRMARTRALLEGKHENPVYNTLALSFLSSRFDRWNIILNSTGYLLKTMQLLRDNIHILDDVLFELGQVGAYLSAAELLADKEHKNSYTMAEFVEDNTRTAPYLVMQGLWNSALGADIAVANDLDIDGMRHLTLLIMGPNACGKSVITQGAPRAVCLAQVFGIGPFTSCKMTLFGGMYSFKEPQDDPNLKMSLFAFELHCTNEHEALLESCRRAGKFVLTCADERFASTNPAEAAALSVAKLHDTMSQYTNNINIMTSHMGYVVSSINRMENAQVRHVQIDRKKDGSYKPLYTLGEGVSKEVVGIDLFKKMVGRGDVVDEARKIFEDIKAGERMAEERRHMVAAA